MSIDTKSITLHQCTEIRLTVSMHRAHLYCTYTQPKLKNKKRIPFRHYEYTYVFNTVTYPLEAKNAELSVSLRPWKLGGSYVSSVSNSALVFHDSLTTTPVRYQGAMQLKERSRFKGNVQCLSSTHPRNTREKRHTLLSKL